GRDGGFAPGRRGAGADAAQHERHAEDHCPAEADGQETDQQPEPDGLGSRPGASGDAGGSAGGHAR
ncbi:MAG: hypothetical protein ACK4YM_10850, partial [Novosphingobium sp.]